MNLNQLEYFVCAAQHMNFTKAAKECYISQTAMTQQIKALEKTLGRQGVSEGGQSDLEA